MELHYKLWVGPVVVVLHFAYEGLTTDDGVLSRIRHHESSAATLTKQLSVKGVLRFLGAP